MKEQEKHNAFLEAYDKHSDAIYRHCYFRVFSKQRAEELVQEAFLRAWQYMSEGKDVENMRALLYRIATNLIIDDSRRRKEESLDGMLESETISEPGEDGRKNLELGILAKDVYAKMKELKPDEREILTLRFVDELEPREIAEILEITPNNASVRINRAVASLRSEIKKDNG